MSGDERLKATLRFYELIGRLEVRIGGTPTLANCHGRMNWPTRGVYFFFEPSEMRTRSGEGLRIVRVGTHALKTGTRRTLWNRLSEHRGPASRLGGDHRVSIFRELLGPALSCQRNTLSPKSWGVAKSRGAAARQLNMSRPDVKRVEADLEACVSRYIRAMPFVVLNIGDVPGPDSKRGLIERSALALLSGSLEPAIDPPSKDWLGRQSDRECVRHSGLWNNDHVCKTCRLSFLDVMDEMIDATEPLRRT